MAEKASRRASAIDMREPRICTVMGFFFKVGPRLLTSVDNSLWTKKVSVGLWADEILKTYDSALTVVAMVDGA